MKVGFMTEIRTENHSYLKLYPLFYTYPFRLIIRSPMSNTNRTVIIKSTVIS